MTNIETHILSLLKEHDCVVIPEIGAFVLKINPTHISAGQVYPASKIISFNKFIVDDDQLLISKLVSEENYTFVTAQAEVLRYSNKIKFEISQKEYFDLEKIGRLKSNNNTLSFVPYSNTQNLDKLNFGFETISIIPIQREIILDNKEAIKLPKIKEEVEKTYSQSPIIRRKKVRTIRKASVLGLAATFLLIFALTSLIYTDTSFDQLKVQNANVLDFLVPSSSNIKTRTGSPKKVVDIQQKVKKRKKKEKEEKSSEKLEALKENTIIEESEPLISKEEVDYPHILRVTSDNPLGFYVVIGAYSNINNANKAKYECSINNSCKIFITEGGLYRVAIYTTTEIELAVEMLAEHKKTNSSYWLLENK